MATTYDYSETIEIFEVFLGQAKTEMERASQSIAKRVASGDYYVKDLVSRLSVLESSVAYLDHVVSDLRGATDDMSPLKLMLSTKFSGVDESMEKGRNLYGDTVMNELLAVEKAAKNN